MLTSKKYQYQDYCIPVELVNEELNHWEAYVDHVVKNTNEPETRVEFDHEPDQEEILWALCLAEGI